MEAVDLDTQAGLSGSELTAPVEVVVVTGLSGAGRSTAAKVLEDLGWYVADNLPPELIPGLIDMSRRAEPSITRLALVMDVRSRFMAPDELSRAIEGMQQPGVHLRVLFLESSDDVLVRRFGFARRRHPLQDSGMVDGTLSDGIAAERKFLAPVKAAADVVIDTTALSIHDLNRQMDEEFGSGRKRQLEITIQSFGFKYGLPLDADFVFDVRFLPNPHWIPELRPFTGKDAQVRDYVLSRDRATGFIESALELLKIVAGGYVDEGKRYMTVAVGCTGGKHRSVAITETLAEQLSSSTTHVVLTAHRDLGRE
ncbi:MAG: RNase adapter RapZ [Nocardiaceae bacterium]|nr:RNase adapter RapZ [Nocardiaceae bacterium]